MAITAAVRQDIMELAVLMNNSAPGTTLLAELVAKSNAGSSLSEIAEHLAGRAEFTCLLYTSPSPRDRTRSRMPSSA